MTVHTALGQLKGVGEVLSKRLQSIGLNTVDDLINYFPKRYDDYSHIITIAALRPGLVSLKVNFSQITERYLRRGMHITKAVAEDSTGRVGVVWFNQPYRAAAIKKDKTYYLSGELVFQRQRLQIINPNIELLSEDPQIQVARILPIYRESSQLNSALIRRLILQVMPVIEQLPDDLPSWMISDYGLMTHRQAIKAIHWPSSQSELAAARQRLGFEELFIVMMASATIKQQLVATQAISVPFKIKLAKAFVENLPFQLTDAQRRTIWQIYKDINRTTPMNRLVEGDVGSGKTVVAAMVSMMVAAAGLQVAFITPTELLAKQHFQTLTSLLAYSSLTNRIALLTGSLKASAKTAIKKQLIDNQISILVGTHALFQEDVDWHKLGVIVIDEQHRFGVEQRQKLHLKAGHMPHTLCMTATPIPRSLALTVYGELAISVLDQTPALRAGVDTVIVSPNSKQKMFEAIQAQLQAGHQVYVVCPLISDSSSLQAASAQKTYENLKSHEFKDWRVGLLHGQMKIDAKTTVMQQFVEHRLDVLVATTVIEVGVDVPNATVMMIESADRFGLAQLHQLRGRVGRAEFRGSCYLIMSDSSQPTKRLQAISQITDGFELAEMDLKLRGAGAIYGTRQHGILDLRIAQLTDVKLIALVRTAVTAFKDKEENLLKYKQLARKIQRASKLTYLN